MLLRAITICGAILNINNVVHRFFCILGVPILFMSNIYHPMDKDSWGFL